MARTDTQISIRVTPDTEAWLRERSQRYMTASLGGQLAADVAMLKSLLDVEAQRLPLTLAEARCLAQIAGGPMMQHGVGLILFAEASDAFRLARQADPTGGHMSSYAVQFGIDEDHLLKRLGELGPAGDLAVREALARWWASRDDDGLSAPQPEDQADEANGFVAAGLRVIEES